MHLSIEVRCKIQMTFLGPCKLLFKISLHGISYWPEMFQADQINWAESSQDFPVFNLQVLR